MLAHPAQHARAVPSPHETAPRRAGGRRLVVRAAAAPPPPTGNERGARQRNLVQRLVQQAAKEAWGGWLGDLVIPLFSEDTGSSAPPPLTQPPRQLADPDSCFVEVSGVTLHYKEAWPAGSSTAAASGSAAASSGGSSSSDGSGNGAVVTGGVGNGTVMSYSSNGGSSNGSGPAGPQQPQQERPTLLLVHGLNGSTFNWRATLQPLADATGCRVVAYDRPPFGLSQRPLTWGQPGQALQVDPYSQEGGAFLAEGLLDALGIGRVIAVGHSAGAITCMELTQRQPQRVAALGFVAPALPTTPENSWQRRANLGTQLRLVATRGLLANDTLGLRYVRRQILRRRDELLAGNMKLHAEEFGMPQDVIDGYLRPLRALDWDRASLLNFRAFSIPPTYDYAGLSQPVLLVQGSNDGGLTVNARELSKLLHARPQGSTSFVELEGVGHVPMDECPQRLNSLLVDFVRQTLPQLGAASGSAEAAEAAEAGPQGPAQRQPAAAPGAA